MVILGLQLPNSLISAVNAGLWKRCGQNSESSFTSKQISQLNRLFPKADDFLPLINDFEVTISETEDFHTEKQCNSIYYGTTTGIGAPGIVVPEHTFLLGYVNIEYPFGLFYQTSEPKLVYLCCQGNELVWLFATGSIDDFMDILRGSDH
jgi:hypothetical protein